MQIITYQIETEVDVTLVCSMFDQRGIPYTIKKNSDLFPYNGERRPFAEILVHCEYEKEARSIFEEVGRRGTIAEELPEENIEAVGKTDQRTPKQRQLWKTILIVYSLAATVLLIKYWDMNRKNSDSKNFTYRWNGDNTALFIRSKENDQLVQTWIDDNSDLNFEAMESHARNTITSRGRDFNEDGFFDEVTYFGMNAKVSGAELDYDNDGRIDESFIVLQNSDTLKLIDHNDDGFFELLEK